MAACNVNDSLNNVACATNGALTAKQQKLVLLDYYYAWMITAGAAYPASVSAWTDFAKCYMSLTDDQVMGIEIQAVLHGIAVGGETIPLDVPFALAETACVAGLSDHELDRILAAFRCSLFQSLTPVV